ncbi:hypothetical protein GCM10027605_69190 [Micromonospora zhanjiangensis]
MDVATTPVETEQAPHRRPKSLDPLELGYTRRAPVPWLAPWLLITTGLRTVLAALFGAYLDKRELQGSLPHHVHRQNTVEGSLWLDYVADLGDGFDATYSIAYLLAQRELTVDGQRLPRGQMLVMGATKSIRPPAPPPTRTAARARTSRRCRTRPPAGRFRRCSRCPATTTGTTV